MKATELRIGNYVLNDNVQNTIVGILSINIGIVNLKTRQGNIINADIDLIKPIPLTEDWLLKFDIKMKCIEKSYRGKYYTFDIDGISYYFFTDKNIIEKLGNNTIYKYVHSFQNLYFALKQKELKMIK